jgi:hypothetical protein
VLPLWIASRIAVVLLAVVGAWLVVPVDRRELPGFLELWHQWDVAQFQKVAEFGYFSDAYDDRTEAFFPGLPLLLRVVHLVVPDWTAAGLLVSFVAGAVALVALWRLAEQESGPVVARHCVLYVVLFPYSVFLAAGYSEALFLAFAVPAWLAARIGAWPLACLLAAGATATRITGVVLVVGLAVELLAQTLRGRSPDTTAVQALRRLLPRLALLAIPVLPVVAYFGYLHAKTGRWDAYAEALRVGWGRDSVSPVSAFTTTLAQARNLDQGTAYLWSWWAEMGALAIGLVVTLLLLAGRRWGEAAYVGTNVALLSTSTYYASGTRALLVWFPAFLLLARWTARHPQAHLFVVAVMAPLAAAITIAFTRATWLG